ncbi:Maf-like protein [Prevotellamassilia timonensis]|jgi:septum formation protein|uniref:Maf-like protein n=1 Tax=Prevotellamassilia timonensis TaxID=1852370 RepID=UPI0008DA484C|nr:Maf-like protein [Prevotellamassilia timonensis]MBD8977416.1 septum formation protein Maf [Prevotellamassilia timonensis]MBL6467681.1 septum formation protein Maf [Prevotellamassilia sp.]MDD7439297.1 Maf-like protein [Prevotellamassilia timonensis]
MLENLNKYEIVLASNSPRRKELLQRMGVNFKVRTLFGIDESYPDSLRGEDIVCYISRNKAKAYQSSMAPNELLITADTIVYVDGEVMGKPKNAEQAKEMLHKLSGKTHQVITGVTIVTAKRTENFGVTSQVKFTNITDEEINFYVDNYLPFDKAGAYGIQEWIGIVAVEEIKGSYFNVVGLPVQRLYQKLKTF